VRSGSPNPEPRREPSPQTVTSKVSTGASKSLYQLRPRTVAFSIKGNPKPSPRKQDSIALAPQYSVGDHTYTPDPKPLSPNPRNTYTPDPKCQLVTTRTTPTRNSNPKHKTRNPKLQLKPETQNPKPETRSAKHENLKPKHETRNTRPAIENPKLVTRNTKPSKPETQNPQT